MKKPLFLAMIFLFAAACFAQDISQSEVPSVVVNAFQQKFPSVKDVEWELKGDLYKVEFETGRRDNEVWINSKGKIVRHKQDISAADLPVPVSESIGRDFSGYRVDDVEKIEEEGKITYKVELKKLQEEWKVTFDAGGKVLDKIRD
jgi:uncharacterized membrane protein YkoI